MLEKLKNVLNSTRFWAIVLGAVVVYLSAKGFIGDLERNLISSILGGYVVVDTSHKLQTK